MAELFDETWFYAPVKAEGEAVALSDDEAHHALRVLRLRPGMEIMVTNGAGSVFRCRLDAARDSAKAYPLERILHEPEPPGLSLALCMLKGRDVELPVEAACEFAVREIFLLLTDHSGEFRGQKFDRMLERLEQKSEAALKQAKKAWRTVVHAPQDLRPWREARLSIPLAVAHPGRDTVPSPLPRELHVLTGPEGGFSGKELDYLFGQPNAYRLSLGSTRLRAVHAPIAALGNLSARR